MEIWKDFDQFYEVSSFGNVKSKTRRVSSTYGGFYEKEGRILKQNDNGKGYAQVQLCYDGIKRTERVHRLVAIVFVPNPLGLSSVNHKDTNKRNNTIGNLEWCTNTYNTQHAAANGLMIKGQTAAVSKLSEGGVMDIKHLIANGFSNREIALLFGVHPGTIQCIRQGRNWSHVKLSEAE
jgi:hypothetical protein